MHGAAHHLAYVHDAFDHGAGLFVQGDVFRAAADEGFLRGDIVAREPFLLVLREFERRAADTDRVTPVGVLYDFAVKHIHLRRADEAGDENVQRMVEDFLRRADLLDLAVFHDDDPVAQCHGLRLVVGDVDERGVQTFPKLDDLRSHLVAELRVQVGERLVHQEHLGVAHDGPADGDPLPLAAGQSLGFSIQIRRDAQDLRGALDHPVHLVLRFRLMTMARIMPRM